MTIYIYIYRAIIWVWLRETTSAVARTAFLALAFVLGLFSSFCSAVSAARYTLSHAFDSMFPSILHNCLWDPRGSLQEHNGAISTTLQASLQEHDGSISTDYPVENMYMAVRLLRITIRCTFSNISQHNSTNSTNIGIIMYQCICTYIHTYICTYRYCLH